MTKDENEEDIEVFPFIEGERVDLVAGNVKWAPLLCKWMNDPKVRQYARNEWPLTLEEIKKWFEPSPNQGMKDFVVFTIYHKEDKKPIGSIGFNHINWLNRNANIFASIGDTEYWGKGIAGEASRLMIKYGFTELNLHKIYSGVFNPNERSLRVAEKLGFKKEAVLKEEIYVDGEFVDLHKFVLFKKEWMEENK
ncbi:MAG: GNAT family N-acetyltransferase [Promethearchaeota archaeon]|jgi:RimJ/RimL family protein N-acetyltransferase